MKFFYNQFKLYRENAGLTLKELGAKIGISYQTIQKWESGAVAPLPKRIPAIAEALRVSVNDLCDLCVDDSDKFPQPVDGETFRAAVIAALIDAPGICDGCRIQILRLVKDLQPTPRP